MIHNLTALARFLDFSFLLSFLFSPTGLKIFAFGNVSRCCLSGVVEGFSKLNVELLFFVRTSFTVGELLDLSNTGIKYQITFRKEIVYGREEHERSKRDGTV